MYLDGVARDFNTGNTVITVFKDGVLHEIDEGDVLRILDPGTEGLVITASEILADPQDDRQHFRRTSGNAEIAPLAALHVDHHRSARRAFGHGYAHASAAPRSTIS